MKIKELKHNHSLTDLLKILLFSILMLAPILAIGVKCGYVMLNKNAYQSASITKTYNEAVINNNLTNDINTWNDIVEGNFYQLDYSPSTTTTDLKVPTPATYTIGKIQNVNLFGIYATTSGSGFNLGTMGGGVGGLGNRLITSGRQIYHIQITNKQWWLDNQTTLQTNIPTFTLSKETNTDFLLGAISVNEITAQTLDNVFYYAIDEIAQEPLFNWTQNTAIYTGVNAMCTGMEITSPIIPILITYWFLLTCIYVIIDILIKGFTMLTHLIGSKMA